MNIVINLAQSCTKKSDTIKRILCKVKWRLLLMMEKKIKGFDYLYLALYAFAGIGLELVLVNLIEPLFGMQMNTFTVAQHIIHWIITSILWLAVGILLIQLAKNKYDFDLWGYTSKFKKWQYIGVLLCMVVSVIAHYIDWGGFKPWIEYQTLGGLKFSFQYIYYVLEAFLISLIVIFGQRACEKWFNNEVFPYGGIVLALSWGLMHIVSKGSIQAGLFTAFYGFLFGSAYLVVGKDYKKALPLMCFMFMI